MLYYDIVFFWNEKIDVFLEYYIYYLCFCFYFGINEYNINYVGM